LIVIAVTSYSRLGTLNGEIENMVNDKLGELSQEAVEKAAKESPEFAAAWIEVVE
jgi:hypothetical protein